MRGGFNLVAMPCRTLFCLVLSLILLPGLVLAKSKKGAGDGEPPPDDRKLVSAVDPVKNTIDITHQSHHIKTTYVFAPNAVIVINGKTVAIKDIKVGLQLFSLKVGSGMDEPAAIEELELKNAQPPPKQK